MSGGGINRPASISLDQLVALNEEMAALVRAGVPLEQGLVDLSREMPGRLGEIAGYLGTRMSAGESLPEIMAREPRRFPPVWRAVIEAGVRSGRLSVALEGLARTGRHVAEMRRMIGVAMIYPLVILTLAYGLFLFSVTMLIPTTQRAFEDLTSSSDPLLAWLSWFGQTAPDWAPWLPVVVLVGLCAWWYRSGRALWSQGVLGRRGGYRNKVSGWPTLTKAKRDGRMATFAEVLALLIEQQVPTEEAIELAADASGDRQLSRAAGEFADRLRQGASGGETPTVPAVFPPLMGWLLASGLHGSGISETLRTTAETYRQRAQRGITWTTIYLPIILTATIGGAATLIQALVIFAPVFRLLYALAQPS